MPTDMLNSDVYTLLAGAVKDLMGHHYVYLYGFTSEHALMSTYCDDKWVLQRVAYSIDDAGNVTFTGEPEEVRLVTKIIPVDNSAGDGVTANQLSTQETSMATETTAPAAEPAVAPTTEQAPAAPAVQAAPKVFANAAEYIAEAPAEMREVLTQSLRMHNERKDLLVNKIKESPRNKLSEEFLKGQSLETLEGLAQLANVTPDMSGVATPTSRAQAADEDKVPAAPKVFEKKA